MLIFILPIIMILLCFCAKQADVSVSEPPSSAETETETERESETEVETETESEPVTEPDIPAVDYFIEQNEDTEKRANELIEELRSMVSEPLYEDYTVHADDPNHVFVDLSIYYENLETGLSIYYRPDYSRPCASVTKAPLALGILERAQSERKSDAPDGKYEEYGLSETYIYLQDDYVWGTGTIQFMDEGTDFTNLSLLKLMITRSDCIALSRITKYYQYDDIRSLVYRLGLDGMRESSANMSCRDGGKIMKEVYAFYQSGAVYGKMLFDWMAKSDECIITHDTLGSNTVIVHKYGFDREGMHDMALVLRDSPYLLTIMTNYTAPSRDQYKYLYGLVKSVDEINKYAKILTDMGNEEIDLE